MHIPLGFYKWSYAGGDFAVGLLPNNVFYCSNYPVHGSSWSVVPTTSSVTPSSTNDGQSSSLQLVIDWKRYGVYEFPISTDAVTAINPTHLHGDARVFCGQCRGPVTDPSTAWRKMEFVREFTPLEKKLMGQGCGSMWTFSWAKGCFEIEFRFDSYQHFVCNLFPEHAHWDLNESEGTGAVITIHWGRYGKCQ